MSTTASISSSQSSLTTTNPKRQVKGADEGQYLQEEKEVVQEQGILFKTVYLIRHGESLGQCVVDENKRRTDINLLDCSLSETGKQQALEIPELLTPRVYDEIEYVLCSPLSRAIETAVLAFPNKPIIIHHELREIGTSIPENIPRPIDKVLFDIRSKVNNCCYFNINVNSLDNIDYSTNIPTTWPKNHDVTPKVIRREKIRTNVVQQYIGTIRNECVVAVVCHYHVIRAALTNTTPNSNIVTTITPRKISTTTVTKSSSSSSTSSLSNSVTTSTPIRISSKKFHTPPQSRRKSSSTFNNSISGMSTTTTTISDSTTTIDTGTPVKTTTPFVSIRQRRLQQTPSTPFLLPNIRPANAIPIKCLLNTMTGQLTIATTSKEIIDS